MISQPLILYMVINDIIPCYLVIATLGCSCGLTGQTTGVTDRDEPVPPFVSAARALEAALVGFATERAETIEPRDGDENIG
jgi:hypothetical protein